MLAADRLVPLRAQTCGRCINGVIAQQSLLALNPRADLNTDYNYDYVWQQGRSTNYGARCAEWPPFVREQNEMRRRLSPPPACRCEDAEQRTAGQCGLDPQLTSPVLACNHAHLQGCSPRQAPG